MPQNFVNIGGQAVIEGVMMRSPKYLSIAVRKPDGKIALFREVNKPWIKRKKIFNLPLIRGGIILIESLVHGIRSISWSAEIAIESERDESEEKNTKKKKKNAFKDKLGTALTLIWGLGLGLLLFFWIPLVLTDWVGAKTGFLFNLVDGIFRLLIFGIYLGLISMWKEIRRIFQYHGAEHKSIFSLEEDNPLTVEGARPMSTLHPRCGTSFLLIVMAVSIFVFMFLGRPETYGDRLIRLLFLPVIGGISYEIIKLSSKFRDNPIARIFIKPGLWLQKITTKEPSDDQLEIGLIALRSAMGEQMDGEDITHYNKEGILETAASDGELEPESIRES
jgi:uncharacterized protein YqhQ